MGAAHGALAMTSTGTYGRNSYHAWLRPGGWCVYISDMHSNIFNPTQIIWQRDTTFDAALLMVGGRMERSEGSRAAVPRRVYVRARAQTSMRE